MIVTPTNLVLSDTYDTGNNPIVGYNNLAPSGTLTATSAESSYPITNLKNPATFLEWRATSTATQTISLTTNSQDVDYVAIARHNIGSIGATIKIEGSTNSGSSWFELVPDSYLVDDTPALFRFTKQVLTNVRAVIAGASSAPRIAVLYAGALLVMQRRVYVGHSPMQLNHDTKVLTGMSENGNFLGRVILSETIAASVSLSNVTPAFVRNSLKPFMLDAKVNPFFFAWRPQSYPLEVGYAWLTSDPRFSNTGSNGLMSADFEMKAIES